MLGLRYAYATEVEKSALKEAFFNTMLLETLQRALEALEGNHGHALYAKGFLDLGIRANVILGELAQALRVQWQVQSTANLCHTIHQPLGQAPDVRLLAKALAYLLNEFVGAQCLVVTHITSVLPPSCCPQIRGHML